MSPKLRSVRELAREEKLMQRPILEILSHGPMTVPQLAEALGHPSREIMYWLMGMRRYGLVEESKEPDDDGYFLYHASEGR